MSEMQRGGLVPVPTEEEEAEKAAKARGIAERLKRRAEKVAGLRLLADLIERNDAIADLVADVDLEVSAWVYDALSDEADQRTAKEKLADAAKAIPGRVEKVATDWYMGVRRDFGGGVRLDVQAVRESVCERVVVGTKRVEREVEVSPAQTRTEVVHEDVVEWRCEPLLDVDPAAV